MPNIKLNYSLVCDNIIFDEKNKASIIGIFEEISSGGIPAIHSKFSVVVSTKGDPGIEANEKIEIINLENEEQIAILQGKIRFEAAGINTFVGNFLNTLFPNFGKYWIKVSVDDQVLTNREQHYVLVKHL